MSQTYPVPSKSALRVLQRIALGTSCTIAFGVGVFTEDRRRRIHSAQQVFENGQRIKSSRKYHSAGSLPLSDFVDQMPPIPKNGHWKQRSATQSATDQTSTSSDAVIPTRLRSVPDFAIDTKVLHPRQALPIFIFPGRNDVPISKRNTSVDSPRRTIRHRTRKKAHQALRQPQTTISTSIEKEQQTTVVDRSENLVEFARRVETILRDPPNEESIDAAITLLLDSFPKGLEVRNITDFLRTTYTKLFHTCVEFRKLDDFLPVLFKFLSLEGLGEAEFYALHAPEIVNHLLKACKTPSHGSIGDTKKLNQAISIFLTKIAAKPAPSSEMYQLGLQLCVASRKAKLYDAIKSVYRHMENFRGDGPDEGLRHLILASCEHGDRKAGIDYFEHLLNIESLSSSPERGKYCFYDLVGAVLFTAVPPNFQAEKEAVLSKAAHLAREAKIKMPNRWLLQVLGDYWLSCQHLSRTEALFKRLAGFLDVTERPQALYDLMIQFCIEAGDEPAARKYFEQCRAVRRSTRAQMRIRGHFALAKAKRHDWEGVRQELLAIKDFKPDKKGVREAESRRILRAALVPILKEYAEAHTVQETEAFIRLFILKYGLVPNSSISNIMMQKFIKDGRLDCYENWLRDIRDWKIPLDPVSFNTLLTQLATKWHLSFLPLLQICHKASAIHGKVIDEKTLDILRTSAIEASTSDPGSPARLFAQIEELRPFLYKETQKDLLVAMREFMSQGDPETALHLFKSAVKEKRPINSIAGAIAVEASLQISETNDLTAAMDTLAQAISHECEISVVIEPLLFHQLKAVKNRKDDIAAVFHRMLAELEDREVEITTKLVTDMINILNSKGGYRSAIDLWNATVLGYQIPTQSVDLFALTALMESHIQLSDLNGDLRGIEWVMDMMSANKIIPDIRFKDLLRLARNRAEEQLTQNRDDDTVKRRLKILHKAYCDTVNRRAEGVANRTTAKNKVLEIMETAAFLTSEKSPTAWKKLRLDVDGVDGLEPASKYGRFTDQPGCAAPHRIGSCGTEVIYSTATDTAANLGSQSRAMNPGDA